MKRWLDELSRIDWVALNVSNGPATAVAAAVRHLDEATTLAEAWKAYWELDNTVVIQGNLFAAAEAVVPFMIALVIEHSDHRRIPGLELLIQLAGGSSHPNEVARGNRDLGDRCRLAAREGLEYFYFLIESASDEVRDRAVELIAVLEEDAQRTQWTMRWVAEHDPNPDTRQLAARLARESL